MSSSKTELPLFLTQSKTLNNLMTPEDAPLRFVSRGITILYGSNGCGKTSICLDLMIDCVRQKKMCIYVETEGGIDYWRIKQMCKEANLTLKEGDKNDFIVGGRAMIIYEPTMAGLMSLIPKIAKKKPDLLIFDSLVAHYIVLILGSAYGTPAKNMAIFSGQIKTFCGQWNMAVVYTTTPVSDVKKSDIFQRSTQAQQNVMLDKGIGLGPHDERPFIGGKQIGFDAKQIVFMQKREGANRRAVLEKHRSKPRGSDCLFAITNQGVGDIGQS